MKLRIVSFFLAAALLLMTACSGSPSESSSGGESSAAPQSSEGTSQSPGRTAAEILLCYNDIPRGTSVLLIVPFFPVQPAGSDGGF